MLRTLLRLQQPYYIALQEKAPLLREREAFLEHLLQQGTSLAAARGVSWQLLNIIRLLKLNRLRGVWVDEIEAAAKKWTRQQRSNPNIRSYKHTGSYFIYVAKKWLRFAGVLKLPATPRTRFADKIGDYARWMTEEAGLSTLTVRSRQQKATLFLKWLSARRRSLASARLRDVDDFLIFKGASGWSRKSACGYADALRSFFRYAEKRGWCKSGIGEGVISPRIYEQEGNEQVFRYNNRATKDNPLNDADRFAVLMSKVGGKRLTYAELTGKGVDSLHNPSAGTGQEEPAPRDARPPKGDSTTIPVTEGQTKVHPTPK